MRHRRVGTLVVPALLALLPGTLAAQRFQLRLAPNPGDTLRMQVEQETEITGEPRPAAPARSMKTALRIYSHAVVIERHGATTLLVARTDSVSIDSDDEHAQALGDQLRRFAGGDPVRIRLAGDGTVRLLDGAGAESVDAAASISLIPAALPPGALAIGDSWVREMPLPVGPATHGGAVRATFRLDSVSQGGRVAYISVSGNLARDAMPAAGPRGTVMSVIGTVAGNLSLDRVRGWISDSRFVVTMHSAIEPPAASGIPPVRFTTVVTQRMRLRDKAAPRRRSRGAGQPDQP